MTNKSGTLHTGISSDLKRRVYEHKHKLVKGITSKYNITRLVWFEEFDDVEQAIEGEKRIKGWLRSKKIALVESMNPEWKDLAECWFSERGHEPSLPQKSEHSHFERTESQTGAARSIDRDPSLRSG